MQEKYIVESWTVFDDIQLSISTRFKYIAGSRWFFLSIFYGCFFFWWLVKPSTLCLTIGKCKGIKYMYPWKSSYMYTQKESCFTVRNIMWDRSMRWHQTLDGPIAKCIWYKLYEHDYNLPFRTVPFIRTDSQRLQLFLRSPFVCTLEKNA